MAKSGYKLLLIGVVALLHSAFWIWLKTTHPDLERENGAMENFQAGCLIISMLGWLACLTKAPSRAAKVFFGGLMLFTFTLLLLEVDLREFDLPTINKIMNGKIRNAWLGILWAIAVYVFVRNFKAVLTRFIAWLRTPSAILMISGGTFWITSALIDKSLLGEKSLFREELMEVNATLLMVGSAWLAYRESRRPSAKQTDR